MVLRGSYSVLRDFGWLVAKSFKPPLAGFCFSCVAKAHARFMHNTLVRS